MLYNNIVLSGLHWINLQDDKWFVEHVPHFGNIWNFLQARYHQWSSRLFIEFVLVNILNCPSYIWAVINSLIMALIFYSISSISNIKHLISYIVLAIAIISYSILPDVGLCSVSINYIWPLACGIFFISVLKDICFDGKNVSLLKKIICCLLLFFSCNAELMCGFLLIFMFFTLLYTSINNEKIDKFVLISLGIILIGLFIHLLCPGNYERIFEDAGDYNKSFHKFSSLSFIQIFLYGFIGSFIGIKQTLFIEMFVVLLFLCGIKLKNKKVITVSSIPVVILLVKRIFVEFLPDSGISLFIKGFFSSSNIIHFFSSPNSSKLMCITLFILFLIFCSVEYVMYKYFDKKSFYYFNVILLTAFAIRLLFSWSPSMFTSQERTFVFTNYFILCLNMIIINSLLKDLKINNKLMKFITFKIKE